MYVFNYDFEINAMQLNHYIHIQNSLQLVGKNNDTVFALTVWKCIVIY